ncbi:hypothetical protein ETB97_010048 [Aspergillus alliaceus]|uniref:Uncharacterized protein n=1 Tax=Petromyces alliaceus TaxID=209559 RepID=A0A8H5ZRJ4_PETAA|nr:hypothetical protein ETB97_010048 [Aspergillus burnettii]
MSGSAAIYAAAFDKRARAAVPSSFCIGGGQNCEPMAFIDRIAPTLFLMVVSDNDVEAVTAAQPKAYASAYEPKRIAVLCDADHFKPYFGPTFEENINAQLSFLNEVLGKH